MSVVTLTKDNFVEEALNTQDTVLIDFWAPWCGPCRMLSPVIDEIAQSLTPGLKVAKVNVDEQPELAMKFGVMSIPTLVVLKGGEIVMSSVGVKSKSSILQMLQSA